MKIAKNARIVQAWRVGDGTEKEKELIAEGKIIRLESGEYRILSQESAKTGGERAEVGDYFKVDSSGFPYPNKKGWFEENHKHIEGNLYEQKPKVLLAWTVDEPETQEIRFLLDNGLLSINEQSDEAYFSAELWGTMEYASKDAVVAFYKVEKNGEEISSINFNLIARDEFEKTYEIVG